MVIYMMLSIALLSCKKFEKTQLLNKNLFQICQSSQYSSILQILRIASMLSLSTKENTQRNFKGREECKFLDIWIYNYKTDISKDNTGHDSGVYK